jgi:hypothetical protein
MARITKQKLIDALTAQGVTLTGDEKFEDLKKLIEDNSIEMEQDEEDEDEADEDADADGLEEISSDPAAPASQSFEPRIPLGTKALAMKAQLSKQQKVRIYIPLATGEKQGVTQSVVLNGYPMYIRKGMYVEVPKSVAEVLEIKLQHKMSIENHPSRVSADHPVKMTTYGN